MARASWALPGGPPVLEAWGENAFVFLIGMLAALSGCSSYRDVTFHFYPNTRTANVPASLRVYDQAQKECAKYGMYAVHYWDTYYFDFERVKVIYNCVQ